MKITKRREDTGDIALYSASAFGKFFQSRYRAVRLPDEAALLACAASVDLNPIRASLAPTLEQSDFASVERRLESLQQETAITQETADNEPFAFPNEPLLSANVAESAMTPAISRIPWRIDSYHH
jgi:hypothetical protein